jgi:hypothetical protein
MFASKYTNTHTYTHRGTISDENNDIMQEGKINNKLGNLSLTTGQMSGKQTKVDIMYMCVYVYVRMCVCVFVCVCSVCLYLCMYACMVCKNVYIHTHTCTYIRHAHIHAVYQQVSVTKNFVQYHTLIDTCTHPHTHNINTNKYIHKHHAPQGRTPSASPNADDRTMSVRPYEDTGSNNMR